MPQLGSWEGQVGGSEVEVVMRRESEPQEGKTLLFLRVSISQRKMVYCSAADDIIDKFSPNHAAAGGTYGLASVINLKGTMSNTCNA